MVEYLSGGRVQGTSVPAIDTSATPDFSDVFTNGDNWTFTNTSGTYWNVGSNRLNWENRIANNASGANHDLGTSFASKKSWLLRFELYIESSKEVQFNGDAVTMFGIHGSTAFNSGVGSGYSSAQDQAHIQIATANTTRYVQGRVCDCTTVQQNQSPLNFTYSNNTQYYCEIKRSNDTYTLRITTNSDYTGGTTAEFTSSLTELRYLHLESWGQNSSYESRNGGYIDNMKLWTKADEKTTLTNVPANTRYEETDTRKIYRAGSVEPVFYYKFDEASGDVINHGSVADADLTVSGLTRDVSTPSGIGNGMSAPSNNSGDYAQNTSRINDYKFMHDGTTKWSVSFWLNLTSFPGSSSWTETYFFGNVWTDDNGIGWVIRTAYQSASVGKLQVFIANNTNTMPLNHSQSDMIPELNAWHHYTVTYDPTASSNQLTMTRDAATSGTGFAQSSTDNENWSTANPTRKVTFFARPTSSYDGGMAGKLAQVIIWKGHILTADEKTALYASGNGTTTLPSPLEWKERNTA